ncbi:hypothetical protein [Algoriphagus sediminis]|uniref:Tetratricopeptide repeat protein n=1 Tax=Algoriphagus sediminis TaxID=3057113 RepID=A0ABT7YHD2_9BACT|nr:hypothetical protein [Algoriphagus sediminis]MDN3205911.1 hypothetical protein [Algoriphagus sediminis]
MKSSLLALAFLLSISFSLFAQHQKSVITINDTEIDIKSAGLSERVFGQPLIILEQDLASPLSSLDLLFSELAKEGPVLSYDRSDLFNSVGNPSELTLDGHARTLRKLLSEMGQRPPYILVGDGLGAYLAKNFVANNQEDVRGLVLLNPTSPGEEVYYENVGSLSGGEADMELSNYIKSLRLACSMKDLGFLSELEKGLDWEKGISPNLPITIILGKKLNTFSWNPGNSKIQKTDLQEVIDQRIEYFQNLTEKMPNSSLLVTPDYTHGMVNSSPMIINLHVQNLVSFDPLNLIAKSAREMSSLEFKLFIEGLETYIPDYKLSERGFNMMGYSLMRSDLNEMALIIFEHNLKKNPNSANVYDSYGDGLFALGRVEESLDAYQRAVALGTFERHSDLGLFIKNLKKAEEALAETND